MALRQTQPIMQVLPVSADPNSPYYAGGPVQIPINNVNPPAAGWGASSGDVGGTSGESNNTPSTNVLSLNIGGARVNYDIGPNTDEFSKSAYSYLSNSFNVDESFLGNTIVGSQNFLAAFAAPLEAFNVTQLPSMYSTLEGQNYSLGSQAVAAETDVARANIAASQASAAEANSSGGGGCFITTATVEVARERDDGETLSMLRSFRDGYMQETVARRRLCWLYKVLAPDMLAKIRARADAREFLERLFTVYIMPARHCVEQGQNEHALVLYTKMLCDMRVVLEV